MSAVEQLSILARKVRNIGAIVSPQARMFGLYLMPLGFSEIVSNSA